MTRGTWRLADDLDEDEQSGAERPRPILVSLHFIRTTLRQRLLVCVLCALLGLGAAGAILLLFPLPHQATASLILTHDPDVDPTRAMETNISLLNSRTVASQTTERLGLALTPDDFNRTVRVEAVGDELLSLTLTADTNAEAVRRLNVLTDVYLNFRAEQLSLQSKVLIDGLQDRTKQLGVEVADLTRQIDRLSKSIAPSSASRLSDAVAQRAYLQGRIETLQQQVEDAGLRNSAVVLSSRVLDLPAAKPGLAKRNVVLGLASGLIGGAALGCGGVLFLAITSNKLRRRSDVADALGTPVQVSVRRVSPVPRGLRWLPGLHFLNRHRSEDRERLAQAFVDRLPPGRPARLAVVGLDNSDEVSFAIAVAAGTLAARGTSTTVIDLTRGGSRGLTLTRWSVGRVDPPTVLRPRWLAPLARGAQDLVRVGQWDEGDNTPVPQLGDATLVLSDFDPAVGLDHLRTWVDRIFLVVTAGKSSVERARTASDLVRDAGLDLRSVALLHTEGTDDSSGLGQLPGPDQAPLPFREGEERNGQQPVAGHPEPAGKAEAL